jgi:hypothetical protein
MRRQRRPVAQRIYISIMSNNSFPRRLKPYLVALMLLVSMVLAPAVSAYVSLSYRTAAEVVPGMAVSAKSGDGQAAEPTTSSNVSKFAGLAYESTEAGNMQVITSGTAPVLVSTLGGNIQAGDPLSISAVAGIAMKAAAGSRIIAWAQQSYNDNTTGSTKQPVKTASGTANFSFGNINATIAESGNNIGNGLIPSGLQNFANELAGRQVSSWRIIVSLVIILSALVTIIVIVETTLRAALVALGRNPLAKKSIFEGLLRVVLFVTLLVLMITGSVYALIAL